MIHSVDEQAMLAIKVMYDRIPNYNMVAEHFGIAPSTVWNYINYSGKEERLQQIKRMYRKSVARKNGYGCYSEYARRKAQQRKSRNRQFCGLIRGRLEAIGQNQNWLADSTGITRQAISQAINGKIKLRRERLPRLSEALKVGLETLINAGGY